MCGIFGVFDQNSNGKIGLQKIEEAIHSIKHRGPNAQKAELISSKVGLGHVRLSIIDLGDQSNQPFHYEHLSMVFNGEIFNYIELRDELMKEGYQFRTKSDTEIIPAAFLKWGEDCVNHLNGMWAFAIYDSKMDVLFCSRDRFGIKPFNYTIHKGLFIFSSEIKAILTYSPELRKPDYNSISRFCRETIGAQAEETWFENIFRLKPAHNLTIKNKTHTITRYWNYPKAVNYNISFDDAREEYLRIFNDSVALRMRSDVPVGLTLSGGVDSASIACSVKFQRKETLKAYTASFPNQPFNEYEIAKELCNYLNYDSIEVKVDYSNYVDKLRKIVYHLESGHGSPAIYPLWHIAERAKEDITVFLEGQGADELEGGYINTMFLDYIRDLLSKGKIRKAIAEIKLHRKNWSLLSSIFLNQRLSMPAFLRKFFRYQKGMEQLYAGELKKHSPFSNSSIDLKNFKSSVNRKSALLHQTGLVNLLHYGDAISMAHSLENRLPFMDFRLVEFVASLPGEFKIKDGLGKYIHRKAVKGSVPDIILENPAKLGFLSPLKQIFSDEKFKATELLTSTKFKSRNLFNQKRITKLIAEHQSKKKNHERILFKILSTELWFQNFID